MANALFFGGGPLLILLCGVILYLAYPVFGPIAPHEAEPFRILSWIAVRDLQKQSPETLDALLDRIETLYGPHSTADEPACFELNDFFRNTLSEALLQRRRFLRTYRLGGIGGGDVSFPEATEEKSVKKSLAEKNIVLLSRCWYLRKMNAYNGASEETRRVVLRETVEELKWWNTFYMNLFTTCEIPKPGLLELAKQCEIFFEEFRGAVGEEEFERMLEFQRVLQSAYVFSEIDSLKEKFFSPKPKKLLLP